ncbi:MAG: TIGR02206 family membrane protein [Phycisphaera sp.]|nr:MAG: TIGR02206 family membrane protein [Phycisphaera sp.]
MNLDLFEKGSVTHLLVLIMSASLVALAVLIQRTTRSKHPQKADRLRLGAGIAVLLFQIVHNVYWLSLREGGFSLEESLPLHFCDITGLIAAAALIFPDRRLVTLLYFWGVGLSSTAFVIPVIAEGPAFLVFWTFWVSHLIVVGGGIFFVLAEGYHPSLRDLLFSLAAATAYVLCLLAINLAIGTNYGYVGEDSPPTAFLGAWPVPRLPLLFLGGALLQTAAWAPFGILHHRRTRQAARP